MCLRSKSDEYLVADEDIPCYKVLVEYGVNKYSTPTIGALVPDDVLAGTRLMVASGDEDIHLDFGCYSVGGGFIHSYAKLTLAMTYSLGYRAIFNCVIPKGERYFVSSDGTQYASKSIRFVKKVG